MQTDHASQSLRLTLTSMAHLGAAVARHEGQVVFADFGIPGEEVLAEVRQRHKQFLRARVTDVLSASPHRVETPCPYFRDCGGCQWQHIAYPHQLELKRQIVTELLQGLGKFGSPPVSPVLGMDDPWRYRNQVRFSVGHGGKLGFVNPQEGSFVRVDRCLIAQPEINDVLAKLQQRTWWQHQITVRYGARTGQLLISPALEIFDGSLATGQPSYEEELLGHRFRVSAPSFFQVNPVQAERLAQLVLERIGDKVDTLLDAYAGVGAFAVVAADRARHIIAMEEAGPSIQDALLNTKGISNIEAMRGKVEELLPRLKQRPDVVILDPPRAGCHPRALEALLALRPSRVIYVSCEPSTLARDLAILCKDFYGLQDIQPVDMFPQTYHIETIATLETRPH